MLAERLRQEIAVAVGPRHVAFTIPKALRGIFEHERALLGWLAHAAYETLPRAPNAEEEWTEARHGVPGALASIQTFGSQPPRSRAE